MTVTWDLLLQALVPVLTKRLLDDHLFPQVQLFTCYFCQKQDCEYFVPL